MSTTHEDKFVPSKEPNWFKRTIASPILPWFIVAIMAFSLAGIITGWTLRSVNVSQIDAAVAAASKEAR